jgi:hypothetical protein
MADCPERKRSSLKKCCGRPEREKASNSWRKMLGKTDMDATRRRLDLADVAREVGYNEELWNPIMKYRHESLANDAGIRSRLLKKNPGERVTLKNLNHGDIDLTELHMAPYDIRNGDQGIIMELNDNDRCIIDATPGRLVKIRLDRFVNVGNQNNSNWRTNAMHGSISRPIASSECYPGSREEKGSEIFENAYAMYGNEIIDNIIILPERNVDFEELWTVPRRGRTKRRRRSRRSKISKRKCKKGGKSKSRRKSRRKSKK